MNNVPQRPLVLLVLDGYGFNSKPIGNAINNANKPNLDFIHQNYPLYLLQASGTAVGLNSGEPGNSEAGHLNIGAGKIVPQYSAFITYSIQNGEFFKKKALVNIMLHLQKTGGALHIVGLLTSGSVHAHFNHLLALINFAHQNNFKSYIHLFTDGRDSGTKEGAELLTKAEKYITDKPELKIVSLVGRGIAMSRNEDWLTTASVYKMLTEGEGRQVANLVESLNTDYRTGLTDEHITPTVLKDKFKNISDGDGVIFFNFREDRMRKLISAFVVQNFDNFPVKTFSNLKVISMTPYDNKFPNETIFRKPVINTPIAAVFAQNGITQLHIAESEKYAHITYFINGFHEEPFSGEIDKILTSIPGSTDDNPQMRTNEIADIVSENINNDSFGFYAINFANPDMLSHTGNLEATIKGIGIMDMALGKIYQAIHAKNGILIITADHGNAEALTYVGSGATETKHNENPVPTYLVLPEFQKVKDLEDLDRETAEPKGLLADIAPTILKLCGLPQPDEMSGEPLL